MIVVPDRRRSLGRQIRRSVRTNRSDEAKALLLDDSFHVGGQNPHRCVTFMPPSGQRSPAAAHDHGGCRLVQWWHGLPPVRLAASLPRLAGRTKQPGGDQHGCYDGRGGSGKGRLRSGPGEPRGTNHRTETFDTSVLALHRVRRHWQADRTARLNAMRGLLRQHGLPIGKSPQLTAAGLRDCRAFSQNTQRLTAVA